MKANMKADVNAGEKIDVKADDETTIKTNFNAGKSGEEVHIKTSEPTRTIGNKREELACRFLTEHGCRILERNFRCRFGEIDIIAKDGQTLVFVEVKYRTSTKYGNPEQAVNYQKRRKIIKTADYYRVRHQILEDVPCRFDILAMTEGHIRHLKYAYDYTGKDI